MPKFSEKSVVEDYLVQQLQAKGWTYLPSSSLEREGYEEPLLIKHLIRKLQELNSTLQITEPDIKAILNELRLRVSGIEGSKQVLHYLKWGIPVKLEKERELRYVQLFDYGAPEKNECIVSRQVTFQSADTQVRADIILFINGIPLAIIECKDPTSISTDWFDAYSQIKGYERAMPELSKYLQIGVAVEQDAYYFPIIPWQDEVKVTMWRVDQKDSLDATIEMLSPATLLDIVQNFIFHRVEFGNATKVIARYMQYRAVNKVVNRVRDNLQQREQKNKGLIWHWQGSGKTLEMIFAAHRLHHMELLENPTAFFIVDRLDLKEQLSDEFAALDMPQPEVVESVADLKKVLIHDEGRGKRGMFITLIHKFRAEELHELKLELETLSRSKETIMNRNNILAFVDEGHRTQYGTLAAEMRDILRSAFFFAFTGTPISKKEKNTYLAFSYPPEEKYLDKYFIAESNKDGYTVRIAYQPRLEKDVQLNKELLDTFLEIEDEELPEDIRENVKDTVKKKLSYIKVYLENPARIKKVAEDIAVHFKENVDKKFKAMVVAVNRTACVRYKTELDSLLPKGYSEVVMTFNERNDPEPIKGHLHDLKERYKGQETEDILKKIIENFEENEFPKILIVTDMLLTGFDAPILQTMYLDKPLKEHRLLQAIARTNRPYKTIKEVGLILDYIGILKEFKKAFEMYSKEDLKEALYNLDELRLEFTTRIQELIALFKDIPKTESDRTTLLKAIEILTSDNETGKTFVEEYKSLRRIFELLGPDTVKAKLFAEYNWLTAIYVYYLKWITPAQQQTDQRYVEQYYAKTLKCIYKATAFEKLNSELPIIQFDENYLNNLEEKIKTKEEKAANIMFTLNRFVLVEKQKNPIYETLTEKVVHLLQLWKERTKDYERIYQKGLKIIQEYLALSKRQRDLKFSELQYSLLLQLEKQFGKDKQLLSDVVDLSKNLKEALFTGWQSQPTARKTVELATRRFIRRYVKRYNMKITQLELLHQKILEHVEKYGK